MVSREDVVAAYRLMLGREPESEAVIEAHRVEQSLDDLSQRILRTPEFRRRISAEVRAPSDPLWICTEIPNGLRLWVDLADQGVSAGCLYGSWEPVETDLLLSVLRPGDTFVDVGANIGWFTILGAHAVGTAGHVHAFEPRADLFDRLKQSVAENRFAERCDLHHLALGKASTELELFWIPEERNPGHSFITSDAPPEGAKQVGKVRVEPLDTIPIGTPVRAMKIDVEGAELQVLLGAADLIERDRPFLLVEIFAKWLNAVGETSPEEVYAWLRARGYRVFKLADTGIGRELHPGEDGYEPNGPEYFSVVALAPRDLETLLSTRLDRRAQDLERLLSLEIEARHAAVAAQASLFQEFDEFRRARQSEVLAQAAKERAEQAEAHSAAAARAAQDASERARLAQAAQASATFALRDREMKLAVAQQRLNAIEASTAWQVTHPIRKAFARMPPSARRRARRAARLVWWTATMQLSKRMKEFMAARRGRTTAMTAPVIAMTAPVTDFWADVFVVRPSGGHGGACRLPPPVRRRVLIIDSHWPRPNRDSGSLDAVVQIDAFRELGYEVVFAGDSDYAEDSSFRRHLEARGVICLAPSNCPSIEAFLHSDGATIDLCVLSRVYSGGRYLEAVRRHAPQAQVIFNTVDLHHLREERQARRIGDMKAFTAAQATRERELYLVRQADATIVVSKVERDVLDRLVPGAYVAEMPLTRKVRDRAAIPPFEGRTGIGFVGGFAHLPNVDAVQFLLDDIWPLVLREMPEARLSIVGADLPAEMLAARSGAVTYLGPVEDLDGWMDGLCLTVAPLRYGAGAKGKVASSLAAGVPCVGTGIAAEGMRLEPGLEIALGEDAAEIARQICRVHTGRAVWEALSTGGHAKAERDLSLEAGKQRLQALIERIRVRAAVSA